jgi:NCAIR mutase (PurE)-related protein
MTPEEMNELLARTMILTERNSEAISRLEQSLEGSTKAIDSNARAIEAIAQQMSMDREERNAVLEAIARQQKQLERHQRILKGLQTENRRILDLLINNQDDEDE